MAKDKDTYIEAHTDKYGTYHVSNYQGDPRGDHTSDHINIKSDGSWTWVERDEDGNVTRHEYDSI